MRHLASGKNIALITSRMTKGEEFAHAFVSRALVEVISMSPKTSNNAFVYPLYVENDDDLLQTTGVKPNFAPAFLKKVAAKLQLVQEGPHGLAAGLTPEDIFHYAYAVFHSPGYRSRYAEFLKIDFPRLPLTGNLELLRALARLGGELTSLHLLESPRLEQLVAEFIGDRNREVGRIAWVANTVFMDAPVCKKGATQGPGTTGFVGVPEEVWGFHIGGYQVCKKWLKDRKGRTLSDEDIAHYQKIVVALADTIRLMNEIDNVIEEHGGWPGAFATKEHVS